MTGNGGRKALDDWQYFAKLKSVSPTLYRVCLVMISLGAGLAIFRVVKQGASYQEILIFVLAGVLFYCVGVLLLFFTKTEARSVVFSAIVLLTFGLWYSFQSADTAFLRDLGPSGKSQLTWCSIPFLTNLCSDPVGDEGKSTPRISNETTPVGQNIVYFQFAGDLDRKEEIIPYLTKLCGNEYGWNIQGCEEGGERTHTAAGLNLIRFYYDKDEENAQRLANAVLDAGPPHGTASDLQLQKLDPSRFDSPAVGTLEIWISN